jgi:uncharacterized YigZ family protein
MEQSDTYLSIREESSGTYREKASKFIAFAFPVTTEDEIRECQIRLRKKYHDANHHCYAYRIGFPDFLYRANDDGEPSGSSGKPIYGQILSAELYDILIVVVRYFGGTKLGIPGLIHAYKTSAREAINNASIVSKTLTENISVVFTYPQMNDVMRILKQEGAIFIYQKFEEKCNINFSIRKSKSRKLKERLKIIQNTSIY